MPKTSSTLLLALAGVAATALAAAPVSFDWFEYSGLDRTRAEPLPAGHYANPILTGFYPDPSICRVGDDYYLTNSTFAYYPGLPIFHSKDLVNWEQIGHAIDRPDQLRYQGLGVSRGIFAPAITHHDDTFYLICTMVDGDGNFVITAKDPAGPWSDPHRLRFSGIDPSLFFDDDGRVWIVNNDDPEGKPLYDGHRAIRIRELDLETMQIKGESKVLVNGGVDISTKPIWIEGPHIYKREGWYYLSCAEGGTGPGHSQVIFRSRNVTGPYVAWENNPIMTQRHLPDDVPGAVTCVGHADLEIGPDGNWWATFLGVRPYDGHASPMGRETFLLPVEWTEDGWPTILPMDQRVPLTHASPGGAVVKPTVELPLAGNFTWRDEFDQPELASAWIMLRTPSEIWWHVDSGFEGKLQLTPRADVLSERGNPSYLARRVQHHDFEAATLAQVPVESGVSAGLVLFQNEGFHYYLGVKRDGQQVQLFLEQVREGKKQIVRTFELPDASQVALRVRAEKARCAFDFSLDGAHWMPLATDLDARMITTAAAGGFVGATVGPHTRTE
ncbi:MAG: glycoside hydrolase family 43 protein [Verrucomicrobiota bacterium JB022]|nr:glycoside hydrolase family 43 protein [Verrucomicrobiota bacterium JB022]